MKKYAINTKKCEENMKGISRKLGKVRRRPWDLENFRTLLYVLALGSSPLLPPQKWHPVGHFSKKKVMKKSEGNKKKYKEIWKIWRK